MAALVFFFGLLAQADEISHIYQKDESVTVWFNKLTPRNNPQETYAFHSLPLCLGDSVDAGRKYALGLGEAIEGFEMEDSRMDLRYQKETKQHRLCSKQLSASDALQLREAVKSQYWLQMYVDDLPVWGPLGKVVETADGEPLSFLYTHFNLLIYYNENQIIQVLFQPEDLVQLESPDEVQEEQILNLFYSVSWLPTATVFENRLNAYKDPGFFESNIHWFSIFNSFVMVVLMCGLVGLILNRTLSKDYAQYEKQEQELDTIGAVINDSAGWKQIAGEVFRAPGQTLIFTTCIGAGCQLLAVIVALLLACLWHPMYSDRGRMTSLTIVLYSLFSIFGGLKSGSFYAQNRGKNWTKAMILSLMALPTIVAAVSLTLNTIAVMYSSSAAIPFISMIEVLGLFLFVAIPLHIEGTILGRTYLSDPQFPYQVSMVRQPILREKRWFQQPLYLISLGGLLPFGSISVETYFIFSSFWNYKLYYVYGFGLVVFLLLLITLACVSVVATYFLLCSEDYRWPWVSFLSAGNTAGYLFVYSVYYYFFRTNMSGMLQFSFFFGYIGIIHLGLTCLCLFLICGTVGYLGSSYFVRVIYTRVKHE